MDESELSYIFSSFFFSGQVYVRGKRRGTEMGVANGEEALISFSFDPKLARGQQEHLPVSTNYCNFPGGGEGEEDESSESFITS